VVAVDVSVVILPEFTWEEAKPRWQEVEARGFARAWTYDHLTWRTLRDGPWVAPLPLLTAVATATSSLRLGTLVASPNYRHPVTLAKEIMTVDDISGGRVDLGVGAGGSGWDVSALGGSALSASDRAGRFEDFVGALDVILRTPAGSYDGPFYSAPDFRSLPGCVQQPRVPFTVAAAGPRALGVAAAFGDAWVTFGPIGETTSPAQWYAGVRAQSERLSEICRSIRRDPSTIRRLVLVSLEQEWAQSSVAAWTDFSGQIEQLGFDEIVLHWPRPAGGGLPGMVPAVLDAVSRG
jgi:alkanesulfonate monooxygenase SsuD/methylene tetrahydromethanopterin reductase-like flavin-dependent oxidoreductase (luciferase family)